MKRIATLLTVGGIFALACTGSPPTAPTQRGTATTSAIVAQSAGVEKTTISGTIQILSLEPPERVIVTPSGTIHRFGLPEHTQFTGNVAGLVTFHASSNCAGDRSHCTFRGPFEGEVTFQGQTGAITGQWTSNCKWDEMLGNLSCGGIMNARGDGDLEGVQFHFEWGPGWWPFSYAGSAFSPW